MTNCRDISDSDIFNNLALWKWTGVSAEEGRLMLVELLVKAGAGYYCSHTEEGFLSEFGILKSDRTPNKRGREFLCSMIYKHSNNRPDCFRLMEIYRQ